MDNNEWPSVIGDNSYKERRQRQRGPTPTDFEVKACFHRLWSSQVGEHGYIKHDWCELQKMLKLRGVSV